MHFDSFKLSLCPLRRFSAALGDRENDGLIGDPRDSVAFHAEQSGSFCPSTASE
jgi:hypothetical protein